MAEPGSPYRMGRLSTVDLLVLTSLDQLIVYCILLTFVTKQDTLMRRSTLLSFPVELVFLGRTYECTRVEQH